jgi:hypothetical protein
MGGIRCLHDKPPAVQQIARPRPFTGAQIPFADRVELFSLVRARVPRTRVSSTAAFFEDAS